MKARINGETTDIREGLTVHGLILDLKLNPKVTVVEKNGEIMSMPGYESEPVEENDVLELIRFVGGG